jgi:hypothetical protein
MAYHDDLLEQAEHLADREIENPLQASLRRAFFGLLRPVSSSGFRIGFSVGDCQSAASTGAHLRAHQDELGIDTGA